MIVLEISTFGVPVEVPSFSCRLHLYAGRLKTHHHHHLELPLLLFCCSDRGLLHIRDRGHLESAGIEIKFQRLKICEDLIRPEGAPG